LTVAVMVLVSAVVLAIVPEVTPPASVTPGCTNVLFDPVLETCTPGRRPGCRSRRARSP
jgi:hypothetical protein